MRRTSVFKIDNPLVFKSKLLAWLRKSDPAVFLDSHAETRPGDSDWDCLAAVGKIADLKKMAGENAFASLKKFHDSKQDWLFGFFGYDLKNETERLGSGHFDGIGFPDLYFFQPKIVVGLRGGEVSVFEEIGESGVGNWELEILGQEYHPISNPRFPISNFQITPRISKTEYLKTIREIKKDIRRGDFYEVNFCQEFFAEGVQINPFEVFERLNEIGKAPFSAFFRSGERFLCSASPERFLRKKGDWLLSQPIKGTRRRGKNAEEDLKNAQELADSAKDRSENVMIVDLTRNDLNRNCAPGSVRVEELFGIHRFETVFQMISSVVGRIRPECHFVDALRDCFPPGSMTGAPKVMAMKRIEKYEKSRRGLYSGAVGYISPEGDFDFNVVIRSVLYNFASRYLSFSVGGAIVFDSDPELEYEECLLKAEAMLRALGLAKVG